MEGIGTGEQGWVSSACNGEYQGNMITLVSLELCKTNAHRKPGVYTHTHTPHTHHTHTTHTHTPHTHTHTPHTHTHMTMHCL